MYATPEGLFNMDASAAAQFILFASIAGELVLVLTLILKRRYLAFPFFLSWLVLVSLSSGLLFWIAHRDASYNIYQRTYVMSSAADYMLQLGVLLEIGNSVLRTSQRSFSRKTLFILLGAAAIGIFGTAHWALYGVSHDSSASAIGNRLISANFFFAYLRLGMFALIAAFSQMLGITWKNHVMRLAGGLAFYSAVSVVVQLTTAHLSRFNPGAYRADYYLLNHVENASFVAALAFWAWSFVQKDAPRKEFTPQMQHFLVSISETAKRNRLGLTRSLGHK